jgi:preprotein translocase subunit YajC
VPIAASSSGGGSLLPFVFIVLIFVAMYFLFIRPQQRRSRETQAMQSRLGAGDEVMTGSGIYGTVTEIDEEAGTVSLEVSPEVVITFARGAVAKVLTSAAQDEEETEEEAEEEPEYQTDTADRPVIERKD